jgi:hypothetical protein
MMVAKLLVLADALVMHLVSDDRQRGSMHRPIRLAKSVAIRGAIRVAMTSVETTRPMLRCRRRQVHRDRRCLQAIFHCAHSLAHLRAKTKNQKKKRKEKKFNDFTNERDAIACKRIDQENSTCATIDRCTFRTPARKSVLARIQSKKEKSLEIIEYSHLSKNHIHIHDVYHLNTQSRSQTPAVGDGARETDS